MKLTAADWILLVLGVGLVVVPDPATTVTGLGLIASVGALKVL